MKSNIFADDNYLFIERKDVFQKLRLSDHYGKDMLDASHLCIVDAASMVDEASAIMDELYRRGIMFVLLEGGGTLAGSFLDAGEIDQFFYIITPKIAGNGMPSLAGSGVSAIHDSLRLKDISVVPIQDDIIYNGYRESYHFEMM